MRKRLHLVALLVCAAAVAAVAGPFTWTARTDGDVLTLTADVAAGHYFYANESLEFKIAGKDGKAAKAESAPSPAEVADEFMGRVKVFPAGRWVWKFRGEPPFTGTVDYQGCRKAAEGKSALCFMPETFALAPGSGVAAETEAAATGDALLERFAPVRKTEGLLSIAQFRDFLAPGEHSATEQTGGMFDGTALWLVILLTLAGGLGLNLTPCVLPMIPVNLAIIGAGGAGRAAGFRRGLAYGTGMAAAYGILGVVVILTGARFGELNSSSVFNFVIAAVFALLAAAMFGWFNLDFSGKLRISPKQVKGGKTVVAFVMGALAALLAGACVAPVVIGVLLFSARLYVEGNYFALGLPFLLGVGMALPWPLAGAGFGILPKPGSFMVTIKYVFGGIIVLAALWYAWVGYTLLPGDFSPRREMAALDRGLADSLRSGKPVLIDFWATWCKNCKEMERDVFPDPEIQKLLNNYEVVKFQAEKLREPEVKALLDRYGVPGLPAFVILKAK